MHVRPHPTRPRALPPGHRLRDVPMRRVLPRDAQQPLASLVGAVTPTQHEVERHRQQDDHDDDEEAQQEGAAPAATV